MKYYFSLQYKRLTRHLRDAGFNPYLTFCSSLVLFAIASHFVFSKIKYAEYIYPLISLALINLLGTIDRNHFLRNCFSIRDYRKIRLIENSIVSLPFLIFLLIKQAYFSAIAFLVLSLVLSFFNGISTISFVVPTPFYKKPFEFITGFRKTFIVFILSNILAVISINVDNFNLGIFSLILSLLTCINFYTKPEPLFYVWTHSDNSSHFLKTKLSIAIFYSFLISLPIAILLASFNLDKTHIILIFELLGILYVISSLLGKYAYYPSEINIVQAFTTGISLLFPPLLLIIIPILYNRSKQNLASILK